jgi:integral membrane protein (TIGR00529 family)
MVWLAFLLSLGLILFLARWNLWAALFAGALLLAFLTAPLSAFPGIFGRAFADPGVLALAAAAGLIPIIGGALQKSGLLRALVAKIPGGRATAYVVAPALFGLLPVPGGALFSAPILDELGGGHPEERAAANVWFRHILLSFYPMSTALLTGAKLSGLDLWQIIPWQLLWALFSVIIGAIFLLRPFFGPKLILADPRDRGFWKALFVLLLAPLLDLLLRKFLPLPAPEVGTALALCVALFFALLLGPGFSSFPALLLESKPWRFALIVFGVFLYLGAFQASGLPRAMASLSLPLGPLVLGLGFLMGLATGRQQAALSVVIPVYLAGPGSLSPWQFSSLYQASYLGYLLSPLHPCLVVSAEYAGTRLSSVLRRLLIPSLAFALAVSLAFCLEFGFQS